MDLQKITAAKLEMIDPEFAFIDWRDPEAKPECADNLWAMLRKPDAEPQLRIAPGHSAG